MATGIYDTERKCETKLLSNLTTRRFIRFVFGYFEIRFIKFNYVQENYNERNCSYVVNPFYDERKGIGHGTTSFSNSRLITWAFSSSPQEIRYVTYALGSKAIMSTASVHLPMRIHDNKNCFITTIPITQRTVFLPARYFNDRIVKLVVLNKHLTSTSYARTLIKHYNERSIYIEQLQKYSQRLINFIELNYGERFCDIAVLQKNYISTAYTHTAIGKLTTERTISIKFRAPASIRKVLLLTEPYSDRQVTLVFEAFDTRLCDFIIQEKFDLATTKILYATPYHSNRTCTFIGIIYLTERKCFVETREIFKYKQPISAKLPITIKSKRDQQVVYPVMSIEDNITLHGNEVSSAIQDINKDTLVNKILIASNTDANVSMVANRFGQVITKDKSVKRLTKVSAKFIFRFIANPTERNLLINHCGFDDRTTIMPFTSYDMRNIITDFYWIENSNKNIMYYYRTEDEKNMIINHCGFNDKLITFYYFIPSERNIMTIFRTYDMRFIRTKFTTNDRKYIVLGNLKDDERLTTFNYMIVGERNCIYNDEDVFIKRYEYDENGRIKRIGYAFAGTSEDDNGWKIKEIVYDMDGYEIGENWANGTQEMINKWSERDTYVYL